ncbi:GNAT family N-acetyltransferase [Blastococcus sp. SYSU DS0539]
MPPRVALGRARVVREVRAADGLAAALAAPVPARAPWLTAVLNDGAARRSPARPLAVVVDDGLGGPPRAAAFLALRRRGPIATVTLLGQDHPHIPAGRPSARLPARDDDAAAALADGVVGFLDSLRGPWALRLTGLPLGDPTARALAARLPTAVLATTRSTLLVDELDGAGAVERSRDPRRLERWLPALLAAEPDRRSRGFLRAAARLHAAVGRLEVAVVPDGDRLRAGLLSLVDGDDRWPWWGTPGSAGLRTGMGAPVAGLTAPARGWPR